MSEAAREYCAQLTRQEAANFYYGMRLLPAHKRAALFAIYAFARRVDDIGDGTLAVDEKRRQLTLAADSLDAAPDGDLVLVALHEAEQAFPLPRQSFLDLIDGVRMDIDGAQYETFEDLALYCRRVAGSIGRLCVAVFGADGANAGELADDLGVALQLTNILRDVREDAARGRTYLPAEDLARFGAPSRETIRPLVAFEVSRARDWYARGMALIPMLDRRSAACVLAMSGIYRRLLDRIEADPDAILERRVALGPLTKVAVATASLLGAGRP
ncbi:MAG TPA: presqualene diphosphate synthase HpnD [Solirubrobacteraceae bacterium]|jgi:phytoene synthase